MGLYPYLIIKEIKTMELTGIIAVSLVLLIIVISLAQYFSNRGLKTQKVRRKTQGMREWYK